MAQLARAVARDQRARPALLAKLDRLVRQETKALQVIEARLALREK
jgi:hypothetical protein